MHGSFDAADPALVELHLRVERLNSQRLRLKLQRRPRHLGHEPLDDLIVQRVPLRLPAVALGIALRRFDVELRLEVQRADQRIRVEEQLQQGIQHPPDKAHQPAMRVVDRGVLERECRLVRDPLGRPLCLGARASPERVKERWLDRAWIEDRFEAPRRQVLDLLVGEIDTLALGDPAADLPHDLLDVNLVASASFLRRRLLRPAIHAAPIGSTPPSMEMASPLSLILVHHRSQYFLNSWPHSVRMNERMRDWPMVGYQNRSWYTLDAKGAHTISGEWSSRRSSGRRKPLRIIWSP